MLCVDDGMSTIPVRGLTIVVCRHRRHQKLLARSQGRSPNLRLPGTAVSDDATERLPLLGPLTTVTLAAATLGTKKSLAHSTTVVSAPWPRASSAWRHRTGRAPTAKIPRISSPRFRYASDARRARRVIVASIDNTGAGEGIRTPDPNLGKVALPLMMSMS
jgi:hypothetical protein